MIDIVEATSKRRMMIIHPIPTTSNRLYVSCTVSLEGSNPWVSVLTLSADYTNECNRLSHFHTTDILAGCQPLRLDWCEWQIGPLSMPFVWNGRDGYIRWCSQQIGSIPILKDCYLPIRECMKRIPNLSWWEWDAGSSLFFWKWPQPYQEWALPYHPQDMD